MDAQGTTLITSGLTDNSIKIWYSFFLPSPHACNLHLMVYPPMQGSGHHARELMSVYPLALGVAGTAQKFQAFLSPRPNMNQTITSFG
jgi:hypothetical protein